MRLAQRYLDKPAPEKREQRIYASSPARSEAVLERARLDPCADREQDLELSGCEDGEIARHGRWRQDCVRRDPLDDPAVDRGLRVHRADAGEQRRGVARIRVVEGDSAAPWLHGA